MKRLATHDDAGFTLPELLVAIVVLGVIMPVLVSAFISGVKTTSGTTERLSSSNDAEFTSSWFVPDVQSAETFSSIDEPTCPSPGTRWLTMKRADGANAIVTGYATLNDGTPSRTLVRYSCTNGVKNPDVTVTHTLSPTVNPVVACTPSPCNASTTKVALTVTVDDATSTGYTFNLNATRRTS